MNPNRDDGTPGFGVYVHWPFCAAKCPYCDFNSHVRHKPVDQARFAAAFRRELATMRSRTGPKEVSSIFIGGGTPSLMKPETVGAILEAVAELWTVPDGIEITMEANPQSADAGRFAGYRAAGVNRLSLGVQALNDADLKFLGRLHDAGEALQAIELARRTFPRLSFDLIYARPGQTLAGWKAELESAIAHAADHLSLYQLTIEEGTPFFALHAAGKINPPDSDMGAALYELTQDVTQTHGLPAYEISNHAAPGAASRHNLTLDDIDPYLIVGPENNAIIWREINKYLIKHGRRQFRRVLESSSYEFSRTFMRHSDGIACLSRSILRPELESGEFVQLDIPVDDLMGSVGVTYRTGTRMSAPVRALFDLFRSTAQTLYP